MASWLHWNPDQSLPLKSMAPPVSVQSVQSLNKPPLCFLSSSAATLSWSCPCSSFHSLPFECEIFLQRWQLEPLFCGGTSKWWVNLILTCVSLFWHLFFFLKLHLDNYSGTGLLWALCSCIEISVLLWCTKGWENDCPWRGHLKPLLFLLPRGWLRQLLSLRVTFSCKTTLLEFFFFLSPEKHRRNKVTFKPGTNTGVFIEPEFTASNAHKAACFVYSFTFLRRKEAKDGVIALKLNWLLSGLTTCSSNLAHAGGWDLPQQSQTSPFPGVSAQKFRCSSIIIQ